jgi:hypothetical protein
MRLAGPVPKGPAAGDDGDDHQGDLDHLPTSNGADGFDDPGVHHRDLGGDGEGEWAGRDVDPGPGLTEPERELADELNRIRELDRARDRVERLAGDGPPGRGGRGASPEDRDALAIIAAAERFGLEASEKDREERDLIKTALASRGSEPKRPDEYSFYAIISKQTTEGRSIVLNLRVPWEFKDEVFRALETMPFAAQVTMRELVGVEV